MPRTFIGALVVGLVSSPINAASSLFKANKDTSQYIGIENMFILVLVASIYNSVYYGLFARSIFLFILTLLPSSW